MICVGYILFSIYLLFYKLNLIVHLYYYSIHYLPLHYMLSINTHSYSLETLIITYYIYFYLGYKGKDVYSVYAIDEFQKII